MRVYHLHPGILTVGKSSVQMRVVPDTRLLKEVGYLTPHERFKTAISFFVLSTTKAQREKTRLNNLNEMAIAMPELVKTPAPFASKLVHLLTWENVQYWESSHTLLCHLRLLLVFPLPQE
jgi:hypothetical protein